MVQILSSGARDTGDIIREMDGNTVWRGWRVEVARK
jgi:hypothetical protein